MSGTNFPILTTKRIVLSKDFDFTPEQRTVRNIAIIDEEGGATLRRETTITPASDREFTKVKVEFIIKSIEQRSISKWFSEEFKQNPDHSRYAEYLKIYFHVLDDSSAEMAGLMQDPKTRYRTGRRLFRNIKASITMAEVLQNENFTTTPVSDTSDYYQHDIYSEVEIDLTGLALDSSEQIHLIGYIHMDVEAYMRDNGITSLPEGEPLPIEKHGGHLVYDLLLERKEKLEIPFYRDALYLDSEPYYGPYHYHGEDNPGPDDYIGYMAGFPGEDMGPKLQAFSIRNYKVVSSIYDLQNDPSVFGIGPLAAHMNRDPGVLLTRTVPLIESLLSTSSRTVEMVRNSIYAESKTKKNFIKGGATKRPTWVDLVQAPDPDTGNISLDGSNHSTLVGLDYYKLVRDLSNYGNIIDLHYNRGNTRIVEVMLRLSTIMNLDIIRNRVTNNPYSFNDTDSLDYKIYDTNIPGRRLVNSRDPQGRGAMPGDRSYSRLLIPASTHDATVTEINLGTVEQLDNGRRIINVPGYNRFFHIKDYDLFHNVQFGKYKYNLKISLTDGISKVIRNILEALKTRHRLFVYYIIDASQPVIRDSQGQYVQGNYDYSLNEFHSSFREEDYTLFINNTIGAFDSAVQLMTGETLEPVVVENLRASISPESTTIATLEYFGNVLNRIVSLLNNLLRQTGDETHSSEYHELKKQGKTYTSATGPGRKARMIEVTVKCPSVATAFSPGKIVANYSVFRRTDDRDNDITPSTPNLGFYDYMERLNNNSDRMNGNLILPSSYTSVEFSPYNVGQYEVQMYSKNPVPDENKVKKTPYLGPTAKVLSSIDSYNNLNLRQKSNKVVMINAARSEKNILAGYLKKSISELVYNSFNSVDLVVGMVGSTRSTDSTRSENSNASDAKQKLKDAFAKAEDDNCIELPDELKRVIETAAGSGVSRKEVEEAADDAGYGDLNGLLEVLEETYDETQELIGMLREDDVGGVPDELLELLSEKGKFEGVKQKDGPDVEDYGLDDRYDIYDAEAAELNVVAPGEPALKFTPEQAQEWTMGEIQAETYLLVKVEPIKKKQDAIEPVNNGLLLRIR